MKKTLAIAVGILAVLSLSACGQKSDSGSSTPAAPVVSDKPLKLFSQVMQSKRTTVWFPIDFTDAFHTQGESLNTETKVPDIVVVKNGKATRYTSVSQNKINNRYSDEGEKIDVEPLDNAPSLGELSKMSTEQIIAKYKELDREAFANYKGTILKQEIQYVNKVARLSRNDVYYYKYKKIPYAKTDPEYTKVYVDWLKQSVAAGYTAPKAHKILAYVAPDSTGNNTQKERLQLGFATSWGKDDTYYQLQDLGKKLNIPVRDVSAGGAVTSFEISPDHTVRSYGTWLDYDGSGQISQEIYKNHYYGLGDASFVLITPKETFKRLGTSNTNIKLDSPTDKNIGKLILK